MTSSIAQRPCMSAISRAKNELITPETYRPPTYWHEAVARVFERYEARKTQNNALDFDDLLLKAEQLFLREHEEVRERYQQRYAHHPGGRVSGYQQRAVRTGAASGRRAHRTCLWWAMRTRASIAGGAPISATCCAFAPISPRLKSLLLEQNYRSTQTILDAAQAVIARNSQRIAQKAVDRERGRLADPLFRGLRRAGRGRIRGHRDLSASSPGRYNPGRLRRHVPHQRPIARAGRCLYAARHALQAHRRARASTSAARSRMCWAICG